MFYRNFQGLALSAFVRVEDAGDVVGELPAKPSVGMTDANANDRQRNLPISIVLIARRLLP